MKRVKENNNKQMETIKQTIPWYNKSTDPLMPAMRAHEDQGHCVVAISVSLKENTSTLMAELALFRFVATQRGIINDVVLDEI